VAAVQLVSAAWSASISQLPTALKETSPLPPMEQTKLDELAMLRTTGAVEGPARSVTW